MRRAIFSGSFDPFTLGHLSIVQKALQTFDEIIINIGCNPEKKALFNTMERKEMIMQTLTEYGLEQKVKLITNNGLTADLALRENVNELIRGIRLGTNDPEAEQNLATFNQYLGKIRGIDLKTNFITEENIFLRTISSSSVKNLCNLQQYIAVAKCVSPFVHQKLMEKYLEQQFVHLSHHPRLMSIRKIYQQLVKNYKPRAFHNLSHIAYMLNMLQIYLSQTDSNCKTKDLAPLILAIFAHDYIYNPLATDNKEQSAKALQQQYECHNFAVPISAVQTLILATASNKEATTELEALISDLNLSILGTFEEDVWKQYNHNIQLEYGEMPHHLYLPKRIETLKNFLNRPRIFQTDFFYTHFENQARYNLNSEIARLKSLY